MSVTNPSSPEEFEKANQVFFDIALETFGDKIKICEFEMDKDELAYLNATYQLEYREEDFKSYGKHAWLTDQTKCPKCDSLLLDFFGTFRWTIVHGQGKCSQCGTLFQYYHYVKKGLRPITGFSLIGFS